jgi:hypothetical protein
MYTTGWRQVTSYNDMPVSVWMADGKYIGGWCGVPEVIGIEVICPVHYANQVELTSVLYLVFDRLVPNQV